MEHKDTDPRAAIASTSFCGGQAKLVGELSGATLGAIYGSLVQHRQATDTAFAKGKAARRINQVLTCLADALSKSADKALMSHLKWSRNAGLPALHAQGITNDHRKRAAKMAVSSSSMKANLVPLNGAALTEIIAKAL